ncbi:RNA polymerase-associated protein RapA [subsurface metagenome]
MNLQYTSNQIIHYELPWNPNRLEQRNGRVDRYGQPKPEVIIRTLVMDDTLEADILKVLIKKAEQIRIDYGFSPPFFGDETTIIDLIKKHKPTFKYGPQTTLLDFIGREADPFDKDNLELIKNDSFYGGLEIGLEEVQQRLNYTYDLIGKPKEIQKFVKNGLKKYGCKRKETEEGIWNIEFSDEFLRGIDLEKKVFNITFDPIIAAKNPSLNLIDFGHPIVVKLIEKIKYSSLNEKVNYGRTAVVKVEMKWPVTAIFHILARYIVDTEPKSIIEELFDAGIEIYTKEIMSEKRVAEIKNASIVQMDRSIDEIRSDIKKSVKLPNLHQIINKQTNLRCLKIEDERKQMKQKFEDDAPKEWLEGIDKISVGSTDIMAVTLYYPSLEG